MMSESLRPIKKGFRYSKGLATTVYAGRRGANWRRKNVELVYLVYSVLRFHRFFIVLAFLLGISCDCHVSLGAFQQRDLDDGVPLFVPSVDVDSPVFFSSVDAARRNRPPLPAKVCEDLYYPDGFLTLSTPTSRKTGVLNGGHNESKVVYPQASEERGEKRASCIRPVDPTVETTPSDVPVLSEPVTESRDHVLFFAISIALAGLGIFLYYDFRYRNQIREDLVHNAKLCSPKAVASDFDEVLAKCPELTDPRQPSFANPNFAPELLEFGVNVPVTNHFEEVNAIGEHLETGPGIEEENMDFSPKGLYVDSSLEVLEDFTVSEKVAGR